VPSVCAPIPIARPQADSPDEHYHEGRPPERTFTNSLGMRMVRIEPGTFTMGETKPPWAGIAVSQGGMVGSEYPAHEVTLTRPVFIGAFPVSQRQYETLAGGNPSTSIVGDDFAVNTVSWHDAVAFCRKLSVKEELSYRLPTEAEWEFACRAGTTTAYSFGEAWDAGAALQPNGWGLYDMHGNVWEWCADWWAVDAYAHSPAVDPRGPEGGVARILRGGAYDFDTHTARSAYRRGLFPNYAYPFAGFRVACEGE